MKCCAGCFVPVARLIPARSKRRRTAAKLAILGRLGALIRAKRLRRIGRIFVAA